MCGRCISSLRKRSEVHTSPLSVMSTEPRVMRPCATPGCHALVTSGHCDAHRNQRDRVQRGTSTARGYDAAFRKLRVLCFARDSWRCVDCGWEPEVVRICREHGISMPPPAVILEELRRAH